MIYRFNTVSIKALAIYLRRNEQAGSKTWMECKETGTGKILKNKNKVRGTSFLISKQSEVTVNKRCSTSKTNCGISIQWSAIHQ